MCLLTKIGKIYKQWDREREKKERERYIKRNKKINRGTEK